VGVDSQFTEIGPVDWVDGQSSHNFNHVDVSQSPRSMVSRNQHFNQSDSTVCGAERTYTVENRHGEFPRIAVAVCGLERGSGRRHCSQQSTFCRQLENGQHNTQKFTRDFLVARYHRVETGELIMSQELIMSRTFLTVFGLLF